MLPYICSQHCYHIYKANNIFFIYAVNNVVVYKQPTMVLFICSQQCCHMYSYTQMHIGNIIIHMQPTMVSYICSQQCCRKYTDNNIILYMQPTRLSYTRRQQCILHSQPTMLSYTCSQVIILSYFQTSTCSSIKPFIIRKAPSYKCHICTQYKNICLQNFTLFFLYTDILIQLLGEYIHIHLQWRQFCRNYFVFRRVNSKKKTIAPHGRKFFPFRAHSFLERT